MKKKKKKIKKKILIILVLIIFCFIILICINNKYQKKISHEVNQEESKIYLEERVLPRNVKVLSQYKGNIKRDTLYLRLNEVVNYFDELNNNFENNSSKEIENYYNKNNDKILKIFGEISLEEFKKIVLEVLEKNIDKFNYAEILNDDFDVLDNYSIFKVKFNYKNNKFIQLDVYLSNTFNNDNSDIIFKY